MPVTSREREPGVQDLLACALMRQRATESWESPSVTLTDGHWRCGPGWGSASIAFTSVPKGRTRILKILRGLINTLRGKCSGHLKLNLQTQENVEYQLIKLLM